GGAGPPTKKTQIILIAAMDEARGIGKGGGIPWDLPEDRLHFRDTTMGHPCLMGRKTYESIGRALPGRPCGVLTTSISFAGDGGDRLIFCRDLNALLQWASNLSALVFVIGGETLYRQTLPLADRLILTHVPGNYGCDVFFPAFEGFEPVSVVQTIDFSVTEWKRLP
ncbi:MAG: dihydrofolate reductase, partial [Proteobacteria bacterium]|nr:dihydrofolate reductase [Pseudomonadota bacterium]